MNLLLHLLTGFGLSFIGSLPLGVINLTVSEVTIRKGLRAALALALGAALVELIQALVAVYFTDLFIHYPLAEQAIQYGSIPIFFGLGLYYFLAQPGPPKITDQSASLDFFKGMFISSINLLAIPYWLFYAGYLSSEAWLTGHSEKFIFVTGVTLGTFALLGLYARLSFKIMQHMGWVEKWSNKVIGAIFILFGSFQSLRMLILT